jgi:hypothetical protein
MAKLETFGSPPTRIPLPSAASSLYMSFDELSERSDGDSIAGSDAETFKGVVEDIEVALTPEPRENHEHFSVSSTVDRHLDAVDAENSANLHNFIVASERLSATPRGGLSSCG